jgi:hypothetical protein
MARGWESKSVEDQVQEFQERDDGDKKKQVSPAEAASHRQLQILQLSRARVQKDLESSRSPRHREQLNRALADLDSQIAKFKPSN